MFTAIRLLCLLALVLPPCASAQDAAATLPQPPQLGAELVKTGLYLISGGGNSLLRFTANGLLLVDGQLPGHYRPLMSQLRKINKISDLPIRALILTDHHAIHAGTTAQFAAARVPIVAQEDTLARLAGSLPADAQRVGYQREYEIRLGGVEVRLMHFGPAHTGGDTVVYFPDLRVVAVGDLYSSGRPEPDADGSLSGWSGALAQVLGLDFDRVVPGAGPMVSRAELEAFKFRLDALAAAAH
jgi:glyoxylase-like metal-dependent hydrolase (beta-lactamase superfamily II)